MFPKQLLIATAVLVGGWLLWHLASGASDRAERQARLAKTEANRAVASPATVRNSSAHAEAAASENDGPLVRTRAELDAAKGRIAELEATVAELAEAWNRFAEDEEAKRVKASMRAWGPEQATGPPDTQGAGDRPSAWASLGADGGVEWLQTDYAKPVEIAQIRILENDNPGAVVKITALLENGAETVLWQGVEPRLAPPADQLFAVPAGHLASSIRIYLDTGKVPGWNEIDAVELIGRDGTRQWARGASASSTYAAQSGAFTNAGNLFLGDTFYQHRGAGKLREMAIDFGGSGAAPR